MINRPVCDTNIINAKLTICFDFHFFFRLQLFISWGKGLLYHMSSFHFWAHIHLKYYDYQNWRGRGVSNITIYLYLHMEIAENIRCQKEPAVGSQKYLYFFPTQRSRHYRTHRDVLDGLWKTWVESNCSHRTRASVALPWSIDKKKKKSYRGIRGRFVPIL